MAEYDEEEYFIPLQDQRVFGAGIKRKRVPFVPARSDSCTVPTPCASDHKAGEHYLSLVLPEEPHRRPTQQTALSGPPEADGTPPNAPQAATCDICHLPLHPRASSAKRHHASFAHQVCLPHSHPPSHIDRSRKGLQYLSSYGWDPDERRGLGADGGGIQFPIKTKVKKDNLGVGSRAFKVGAGVKQRDKPVKLGAKEVRQMEERGKKRRERLQEMFYGNDDLEKYLGSAG